MSAETGHPGIRRGADTQVCPCGQSYFKVSKFSLQNNQEDEQMKTIIETQLDSDFITALEASDQEPLLIEVHGKKFIVLKKEDDSEQSEIPPLSGNDFLTDFFRKSPLYGIELDLERDKSSSRELEF
jgi:hypothetical protein